MNLSEALNFAVKKIVEQGGRCIGMDGDCAYGRGGRHCAVGWLLDHTNEELMDFIGDVDAVCNDFFEEIPEVILQNKRVFFKLQQFHDETRSAMRRAHFNDLKIIKPEVDYSGDHWEKWINMGT